MTDEAPKMPEPFNSIIDRVCAADRKWFEAHPSATFYDRPYEPGEFWPAEDLDEQLVVGVRVTLIAPGVRSRQPIGMLP